MDRRQLALRGVDMGRKGASVEARKVAKPLSGHIYGGSNARAVLGHQSLGLGHRPGAQTAD
eukprot:10860418-Alexandrium_andersonii.AAC.1